MIKHGEAPYLECSSRGDKRFSAFCAVVNGKTIEEQYQAFKIFEDGSTGLHWRKAKGRHAVNQKMAEAFYTDLWVTYIYNDPTLIEVLIKETGLSDMFGENGHVCQATVLWGIRNHYLRTSVFNSEWTK